MQEKKEKIEYKKNNNFKINIIFYHSAVALEKVIERAFGNYVLKR